MGKGKILAGLLVFALTLVSGCAEMNSRPGSPAIDAIQQRGELIVGTSGSMPPLSMTTKDGKVIGFDIDMARYMADSMGVKLNVQTMSFKELLPALQAGQVDVVISNMTMTPERNLKVAFVGPYLTSGKCILSKIETLAQADETTEINDPKTRLAAVEGSTSQVFVEELAPKAKLFPTKDYDEALGMVFQDKVHAMVADYPLCVVALMRYPDKGLISALSLLTYEPLGVALPANDPLLVNWMDNFLHRLKKTGHLAKLKARWFEREDWLDQLP